MNPSEFLLYERHRGDAFKFFAVCFYPPQKDLFLEENLVGNLIQSLHHTCPQAKVFAERMKETLLRSGSEELNVEYAKLFLGPYELQAPPYGSIYLDGKKRVMDDSTVEVLRTYHEAGLDLSEDFKDLPDHIAAELEFMYYLICKEVDSVERQALGDAQSIRETQTVFLKEFLNSWVPAFCEKIKQGTGSVFYASLADCLLTFLMHPYPDLPAEFSEKNSLPRQN